MEAVRQQQEAESMSKANISDPNGKLKEMPTVTSKVEEKNFRWVIASRRRDIGPKIFDGGREKQRS